MKKTLTILSLIFTISFINAQKIKFKKGDIFIDGEKTMKYDISGNNYSLLNLNDDEILFMKFVDNNTENYRSDDYLVLNFIEHKVKVETTDIDWIYEVGTKKSHLRKILKLILKEKVIDSNGIIDKEKLTRFYDKHDEEVSERTIRN